MTKRDKLIRKAFNNPKGLSFVEFELILKHVGWVLDHQRGSHKIWYFPDGSRLSVQERKGMAKEYTDRF